MLTRKIRVILNFATRKKMFEFNFTKDLTLIQNIHLAQCILFKKYEFSFITYPKVYSFKKEYLLNINEKLENLMLDDGDELLIF